MPKDDTQEWAIQDEATGEWWASPCVWTRDCVRRHETYAQAAALFVNNCGDRNVTARIVPAPPREMTDVECGAWLLRNNTLRFGASALEPGKFTVYPMLDAQNAVYGNTLFDTIRAARKKLEGK